MGQTFVYNTGKAEVEDKHIEVVFGVFIDGTLNNKTNKEMRDKHGRTDADGKLHKEWSNEEIEKKDNEAYKKIENKSRIRDLVEKENRTDAEQAELNAVPQRDRYLVASHRTWLDKFGTDNSFSNDYTNVARMWTCCSRDYRIYVEGMGTEDNLVDSQDGFAFGSGRTGIRSRVRKGCEELAKKILKEKNKDSTKILTQVTVDVFGFSRGAASARNFVYEVNKKKAYKPKEVELFDGYYQSSSSGFEMGSAPTKKYKTVKGDSDGIVIDESVLVDGMLPRMGYLGYCLAKSGQFTPDEIDNLTLVVRFLGVYETVSSYYGNL